MVSEGISASRTPLGRENGKWFSPRRYWDREDLLQAFALTASPPRTLSRPRPTLKGDLPVNRTHEAGAGSGHLFPLSVEFTDGFWARAAPAHPVLLPWSSFVACRLPGFCVASYLTHSDLSLPQAILHAERQFLRRSWSMWCQQAVAHRLERQRQAVACAHHRLRWLRKAFCVWRESARGLRTE